MSLRKKVASVAKKKYPTSPATLNYVIWEEEAKILLGGPTLLYCLNGHKHIKGVPETKILWLAAFIR